jgi:hypothetical protein
MRSIKYGAGVAAAALSATLLISACVGDTTAGPVQSKQIDSCNPLSMGLIAVVEQAPAGRGRSGSGGGKGGSGKTDMKKSDSNKPSGTGTKAPAAPGSTPTKGSGKGKVCSTEYELFVLDEEDGVVEQDVTSDEYARCAVGEQYPACKED